MCWRSVWCGLCFVENVFDKDQTRMLAANNLQLSEDDDVLVAALKASPYAISFFGYAYYLENRDALRVIDVNGATPTRLTAEDGSYPLSRPLYIYSDANVMRDKPQVGLFVQFFLNRVNEHIEEVGYFPASEDALNEGRKMLNEALTN